MHDHQDGEHFHSIDTRSTSQRYLTWALVINLVFLIIEVIGGIVANSLALLADAGHMFTDVAALSLSLVVLKLAKRPMTARRTFGLLRAEVLGAFINGATLVLIVGLIFWEAWKRIGPVQEIDVPLMLGIASFGLLANVGSALILARNRKQDINVQGAFLHMFADSLGSVGVIVAGAVIWWTGWYPADPIASVVIGILILWSSWGFLKRTMNILLEATPEGIDPGEVKKMLEDMEHVRSVHDLHIWTITSGMPILTAHLTMSDECCTRNHWPVCLDVAKSKIRERFGIVHTTLEIETCESPRCDEVCQFLQQGRKQ